MFVAWCLPFGVSCAVRCRLLNGDCCVLVAVLFAGCCFMFAVCCWLCGVCCVLFAAWCSLFVACVGRCLMLLVVRGSLFVVWCEMCVVWCVLFESCYPLSAVCC